MNPLLLLLVGLAIVLGGILWLRLHPFLALVLGAFVVGSLTDDSFLHQSMQSKYRGDLTRQATDAEVLRQARELKDQGQSIDFQELRTKVELELRSQSDEFDAEASAQATKFTEGNPALKRVISALGTTCEKLGLLIAMACVVGRCLLASGAAERIVRGALGFVGPNGAPFAFAASSFVLSVPVFFDSMFLLVIPLAKATWLKLRKNYLLLVLALVAGGTITHSLVPPTPGPLFVAEELGVNIGMMILVGMGIGACCTVVGCLYAYWINSKMDIPVRESPEALRELEKLAERPMGELPSMALSLFPVLLPVAMISGATIYKSSLDPTESVPNAINFFGDKNVALSISAIVSMLLAGSYLKDRKLLSDQVQQALQEAGIIILVCCGGGAFGATLQQSGIGPYIRTLMGSEPLDYGLLPLAFLVTAVIRGAQGSATVAMFTGVAIVRSLVPDLSELSYHPVYLAVAIGCGSKPFPWMNDSGFWVVGKMSGMTEQETLKTHTPMVTLMGFAGIIVTIIAAFVFPMKQ